MESLRTILAILLCVTIWVVWVTFFAPRQPANQPVPVPPPVPPVAQEKPGEAVGKAAVAPRDRPEVAAKGVELTGGGPQEKPRFSLRLTNQGAGIQEAILPEFQARDGKGPEVFIPQVGGSPVTLGLSVERLKVGGKAVDPAEMVA